MQRKVALAGLLDLYPDRERRDLERRIRTQRERSMRVALVERTERAKKPAFPERSIKDPPPLS